MKYDTDTARAMLPFGPNSKLSNVEKYLAHRRDAINHPLVSDHIIENMIYIWDKLSLKEQEEIRSYIKMDDALE